MKFCVWGTGCGAGDLIDRGLDPERISAFLDSEPACGSFLGRPVKRPEEIAGEDFELILVASRQAEAVAAKAEAAGIPQEKLLFLKNNWLLADRNRSYDKAAEVLPDELLRAVRAPQRAVREPLWTEGGESPLDERDLENDYVRLRTLEAVCRELADIPGAAAELGVYRGGFARCINALLPERTLYLFDTFTGFGEAEAAGEGQGLVEAHRNTAVSAVLRRMPHPERIAVKQGLFPDSLGGLEEIFALVSLDADLEESTLSGLRWFYPRLSPGGFLLLHDYNSPRLPGVRRALRRYERELGRRLPAVPLCDVNGTLVLCKEGKIDGEQDESTKKPSKNL